MTEEQDRKNFLNNIMPQLIAALTGGNAAVKLTASHDYGAGHADWVLANTEQVCGVLIVANAGQAANIVAPVPGAGNTLKYTVINNSGFAITIKKSGGTGITIANTKSAEVLYSGSDYIRITPDT